jgi:hypothetical protein
MNAVEQTILENQNILPAQFFPGRPDAARIEPLRRLALAVLMDAVRVFQNNFGARTLNGRRQFNEAREWLLGAPGHGPFSFENVCYITNIDAGRLRRSLRGWQALKRAGQPCRTLARRSPVTRLGALHPRRSDRPSAQSA